MALLPLLWGGSNAICYHFYASVRRYYILVYILWQRYLSHLSNWQILWMYYSLRIFVAFIRIALFLNTECVNKIDSLRKTQSIVNDPLFACNSFQRSHIETLLENKNVIIQSYCVEQWCASILFYVLIYSWYLISKYRYKHKTWWKTNESLCGYNVWLVK